MSIPDWDSVFCSNLHCEVYNVNGYCIECLVKFFDFVHRVKGTTLTEGNFDTLWKEFEKKYGEELENIIESLKCRREQKTDAAPADSN